MSRCRQTDAILDATFAGAGLTRAEAAHVADCGECARATSQVRRFDAELGRVGVDLSPEPMPAGAELAAVTTPSPERGGRSMTLRRSLVGGAAAAAVLLAAVVFGGGQWLGSTFGGALPPGGIASEDLNAWLDNALASVIDETGRGARPADWEPVQVEECGTTAIAFFAERDPDSNRAFRWAVGEPGRLPMVDAGGLTGTLTDAGVAAIRGSLPVCSLIVDPALGEEQTRDALQRAREAWDASATVRMGAPIPDPEVLEDAQITNMSRIGRDLYGVVLEYRDGTVARVDRVMLSVAGDGTFEVQNAGLDEAGAQPLVVYRDPTFGAATYFAFTGDSGAAAMEFIGPGKVLRYPVSGSGFMLEGVVPVDAVTEYRILDAEGRSLASGRIEVWCRGEEDTPLPGAGC